MSDEDMFLPPGDRRGERGDARSKALENELRALFAPVAAPPGFRERLKADLLHGNERLVLVGAAGGSDRRLPRRPWVPARAMITHPRAAFATGALAVAAAVVLALSLNAAHFGPPLLPNAFGRHSGAPTKPTKGPGRPSVVSLTPTMAPATAMPPPASPTLRSAPPTATAPSVPAITRRTATPMGAVATATAAPTMTRGLAPAAAPTATRATANTATAQPTPIATSPATTATTIVAPSASATTETATTTPIARTPTPAIRTAPTAAPPTRAPAPTAPPTRAPAPTPTTAVLTPTPRPAILLHSTPRPRATAPVPATPTPRPVRVSKPRPTARPRHPNGIHSLPPTLPARTTPAPTRTASVTPAPSVPRATATAKPRPRPRTTARQVTPTAVPVATATRERVAPTPRPSATATATATARATAAPTMTATAVPTATATSIPTATATPAHNQLFPSNQLSLPVPGVTNAILGSPLRDALGFDQTQNVSYTVPVSWTLPQFASSLPVYPIARTPVTTTDALAIARQLGARNSLGVIPGADGQLETRVQLDGAPYTLTVYAGYGTPWFKLRALSPAPGILSSVRLSTQAGAWLQEHNVQRPDMRLLSAGDGAVTYGQTMDGAALLGPSVLSLSFDSRGALRELIDEYIVPHAPIPWPSQSSNNAAYDAITGQGLYTGPTTATVTGPALVSSVSIAYVGVSGVKSDYLEPVYVLGGAIPTTAGPSPQPFDLYISALNSSAGDTPQP